MGKYPDNIQFAVLFSEKTSKNRGRSHVDAELWNGSTPRSPEVEISMSTAGWDNNMVFIWDV